jgi:hypothetical protein
MKRTIALLFMGLLILTSGSTFAQCKLKSGDVKVLKGQTSINLRFDYSDMAVGKYKSEQDYVKDKVAEMNKKKAGSGDEWLGKWTGDRTSKFEPVFEKNLNDELKKYQVVCAQATEGAKYTLVIHTTFTEPGFNAVVGPRKNANVTLAVNLVESGDPQKVLASIEMKNVQSSSMGGYDYDTGSRIQSSYDKAGEELGEFLAKNAFK